MKETVSLKQTGWIVFSGLGRPSAGYFSLRLFLAAFTTQIQAITIIVPNTNAINKDNDRVMFGKPYVVLLADLFVVCSALAILVD